MVSSDDQGEAILLSLRRIIRAIDLHSRQLVQRHGLTGPQLIMLRAIESGGEQSIGRLAETVSLGNGTVTGIVDRLERAGWVHRRRSDEDRRRVLVGLTAEGRRRLEAAPSPLQERFLERLDELADWERSLILSSLQRIAAMMEAGSLDVSPVLVSGPVGATAKETATLLGAVPADDDARS